QLSRNIPQIAENPRKQLNSWLLLNYSRVIVDCPPINNLSHPRGKLHFYENCCALYLMPFAPWVRVSWNECRFCPTEGGSYDRRASQQLFSRPKCKTSKQCRRSSRKRKSTHSKCIPAGRRYARQL